MQTQSCSRPSSLLRVSTLVEKIHRIAAHLEIKRILPILHLVRHTPCTERVCRQQPTWKSSEYSPSRILYSCASNLTSRSRVPAAKGE